MLDTMLKIEDKEEVDKVKEFLETLTEEEQRQAFIFIQGTRFGARAVQEKSKEPA